MPIALALLVFLQAAPAAAPAPSDPVAGDWRPIADEDILIMTLAGNRQVVIRLSPRYAPEHVANIRKLARAHWWDGTSVYRVQENWVAQWGGAPTDDEQKPMPAGIAARPAEEYEFQDFAPAQRLGKADAYSAASGVSADGWPIASDGKAAWLAHCYGTVGVARDAAPDTGSGGELFTPIGQSARRLDRNYTIIGRIVEGMQYLSALPRSDAPLGVYATKAERTPIVSVRLASDIPAPQRPHFEYRATDNPRYAALIRSKQQPAPPTVATGLDVCDLPVAVRRVGTVS